MKIQGILMTAVLLILCTVTPASGQDVKIGYVDRIQIFSQLESWAQADQELARLQQSAQIELQGILYEADSLNKALAEQTMLRDETRQKYQIRIGQLSGDYQRIQVLRQQDIVQAEQTLKGPILERFDKVIEDIGIAEGYTMIYDKAANAIVFASGGRDLTEQVLFEMKKIEN